MSLIIFILVLSVLIIVHEYGHFMAARYFGVKVERFAVGFGKKLFSRKSGETEFLICAIPLGGYVKMAGEERSQCKGSPEEFFSKPIWQRFIIVLMGPVTNFVFAFACFYLIFVSGFPLVVSKIGRVLEKSPAQAAGLLPGDQVLQIDNRAIKSWDDIPEYVVHSEGGTLRFIVERNGQRIEKDISPQQRERKNIFGKVVRVRQIGIGPLENPGKNDIVFVRYGIIGSVARSYQQIEFITVITFQGLFEVLTGVKPVGEALGGPIAIFGAVREAAAMGFTYLLMITAVISTSLAIFNLFPVPVLDGGHLFFLIIESIRRRPLPPKWEEGFMKAGLSLLICLMVFVFYNDMVRAGWIAKISGWVAQVKPPK